MFNFITLFLLMALSIGANSAPKTLLDWNSGEGKNLSNWIYVSDFGYGEKGWKLDNDPNIGGHQNFLNGWGPRSFDKIDYGFDNIVEIDKKNYAPTSANGGGSLHIASKGGDNRSTFWVWYDGVPLSSRGITNSKTDRMSFYIKLKNTPDFYNKNTLPTATVDVGTYLCWGDGSGNGRGNGCPFEGPGNQHYYHYLSPNSGAWIHVLLDQYPQHLRGIGTPSSNNPTLLSDNKNYFEQLSQFYIQQSELSSKPTEFWLDEINFYSTSTTVEPNQNEESISTLWVGYWPKTKLWEIGFNDNSVSGSEKKTYEIRWSTTPITNTNFNNATPIIPNKYGGIQATGVKYYLSRPNASQKAAWTQFEIPIPAIKDLTNIYFAVKDISIAGSHIGTIYPWNYGDTIDAPNNKIKTIDYTLSQSFFLKPLPPTNILIKN